MRRRFHLAILIACAISCARQSSPSEQRANAAREVTVIGCIERGGKAGEVVIRGRDVEGTTGTGIGRERGAVPSTETMGGGDADRNARPGRPIEQRASLLTPRLESSDARDLSSRIGQRALVRGEFEPAGMGRPYDTIKVASIETIAASCAEP